MGGAQKKLRWTDEAVAEGIMTCVKGLHLNRMPSKSEIESFFNNYCLANAITKSRIGFRGWAKRLALDIKESETAMGQDYEVIASTVLANKGFDVERMTTKESFDFLVSGSVRLDVKVGSRWHVDGGAQANSFGINKRFATCDIYMLFALDDNNQIERTLIVPSFLVRSSTVTIGKNSSYNIWNERYDIISRYADFFSGVKSSLLF